MEKVVENAPTVFDEDNTLMRDEIRRTTAKMIARVETLLDGGDLSAGELDKLAGVLKDAAALLGLRSPLDDEEQRAKIAVLLARADGSGKAPGVVRIEWGEEVDELAK